MRWVWEYRSAGGNGTVEWFCPVRLSAVSDFLFLFLRVLFGPLSHSHKSLHSVHTSNVNYELYSSREINYNYTVCSSTKNGTTTAHCNPSNQERLHSEVQSERSVLFTCNKGIGGMLLAWITNKLSMNSERVRKRKKIQNIWKWTRKTIEWGKANDDLVPHS